MITSKIRLRRLENREKDGVTFEPRSLDFECHPFHQPSNLIFEDILMRRFYDRGLTSRRTVMWVEKWLDRLARHDPMTATHSTSVGVGAWWICFQQGCSPEDQKVRLIAGALHDVGKLLVDPKVLRAGDDEFEANRDAYWAQLKEHVTHGYQLLIRERHPLAEVCANVAQFHHIDQRNSYPDVATLARLNIQRPTDVGFDSLLMDEVVGDNLASAGRPDQKKDKEVKTNGQKIPCPEMTQAQARDIDILHKISTREERKEALALRAPHAADLIRLAFDEGIVV